MPRTTRRAQRRLCSVRLERPSRRPRRAPEQPLRLNLKLSDNTRLSDIRRKLPKLVGRAISVCNAARLTACRGKLFSGDAKGGWPVHAASFLRQRKIVLDTYLLRRPRLLRLILLHELFHFVWVRLDNRKRQEFAAMLHGELRCRARGEIGESSSVQKERLLARAYVCGSRPWRDYVCEAFCDTAAWLYAGARTQSGAVLAARWRDRREHWFRATFEAGCRC